jgi:hypothetical protein
MKNLITNKNPSKVLLKTKINIQQNKSFISLLQNLKLNGISKNKKTNLTPNIHNLFNNNYKIFQNFHFFSFSSNIKHDENDENIDNKDKDRNKKEKIKKEKIEENINFNINKNVKENQLDKDKDKYKDEEINIEIKESKIHYQNQNQYQNQYQYQGNRKPEIKLLKIKKNKKILRKILNKNIYPIDKNNEEENLNQNQNQNFNLINKEKENENDKTQENDIDDFEDEENYFFEDNINKFKLNQIDNNIIINDNKSFLNEIKDRKIISTFDKTTKIDNINNYNDNNTKIENIKFEEYKTVINIINNLTENFETLNLKIAVDYIQSNYIEDNYILKKFENIFAENLIELDSSIKSEIVHLLSKSLQKKKLKFKEENWLLIFNDFKHIADLNLLSFKDYFYYIIAFDKIKSIVYNSKPKFLLEFERFVNNENLNILNSNKISFNNLDDLLLLSSLIQQKIIILANINDNIWIEVNKLLIKESHKLNINIFLIIISLFINLSEVNFKSTIYLQEASEKLGEFYITIFKNFELFYPAEKRIIINFSNSLFIFYFNFLLSPTFNLQDSFENFLNENLNKLNNSINQNFSDEEQLNLFFQSTKEGYYLSNLIYLYQQKLEEKLEFNFFTDQRIFLFLSKVLKFHNEDFWKISAENLKDFITSGADLSSKINDILPKHLKSSGKKNTKNNQEIEEMSKLFYYGIMIEIFSTVGYGTKKLSNKSIENYNTSNNNNNYIDDNEFWKIILENFDDIIPSNKKEPIILLQFISLHCQNIYKNKNYLDLYKKLVLKFSPENKKIFFNVEIMDFLIGINFKRMEFDKTRNKKIILDLIKIEPKIINPKEQKIIREIHKKKLNELIDLSNDKIFFFEKKPLNKNLNKINNNNNNKGDNLNSNNILNHGIDIDTPIEKKYNYLDEENDNDEDDDENEDDDEEDIFFDSDEENLEVDMFLKNGKKNNSNNNNVNNNLNAKKNDFTNDNDNNNNNIFKDYISDRKNLRNSKIKKKIYSDAYVDNENENKKIEEIFNKQSDTALEAINDNNSKNNINDNHNDNDNDNKNDNEFNYYRKLENSKDPQRVILLINYLNLIWNKNIFDEEVFYFIYYLLFKVLFYLLFII